MLDLIFTNNILEFRDDFFKISSVDLVDINMVHVHIYNEIYNEIIGVTANRTTINGVLQTSAQMIIDTLTNA
jgi:hypothetical protein